MEPETLRALQRRDRDAVAAVVREHAGDLYRAALGLGFSETDSEELAQETLATFLDAAGRFEGRSSVRTFLFGILYRKAMERRRASSRELPTDPVDAVFEGRFDARGHWSRPPEGPDRQLELDETAALLRECLEGLPERQRAAFQLREVSQQTGAEVCNVMGIEDTHLRVLLFRARVRLRECLESKWKTRS